MEIAQLQQIDNKFTCAIDFYLESIVLGFITKFVVDTAKSYNAIEKDLLKGPRGRYIRSMDTSIKILLYDKGLMTMELDN
jgi:hypothetical protein